MNSDNPWQTYVLLCGISALVGGGCGAGAALTFAERRVAQVEIALEGLRKRVAKLEALHARVDQLEAAGRDGLQA